MTEYLCLAEIDGELYQFHTLAAVTLTQAYDQFNEYLSDRFDIPIELASHCQFQRIQLDTVH